MCIVHHRKADEILLLFSLLVDCDAYKTSQQQIGSVPPDLVRMMLSSSAMLVMNEMSKLNRFFFRGVVKKSISANSHANFTLQH